MSRFSFCASTIYFGAAAAAQSAIQFLVSPKKFGPAQNSLGPVEGQGIKVKEWSETKIRSRTLNMIKIVDMILAQLIQSNPPYIVQPKVGD